MTLSALLKGLTYKVIQGTEDLEIESIVYDSRKACLNCLFICIQGAVVDGHSFVDDVIAKGATAIIVEHPIETRGNSSVTIIQVTNSRKALAYTSAAYFGHPANHLITIGVTGTKGKTTTTYMLKAILEKAGHKTGLIGTIETLIGNKRIPSNNTTPESFFVQQYFYEMVKEGCEYVVMEVSSQGLKYDRVTGFTFDYALFTNLEPDHIGPNEHEDFSDYLHSKSLLFQRCKIGFVNADDVHTSELLTNHTCSIKSYGLSSAAEVQAINLKKEKRDGHIGTFFETIGDFNDSFYVGLPGTFNVYNALAAITVCNYLSIPSTAINAALQNITIKGRVEIVPLSKEFITLIDYAHNAMSLENLLQTLREYNPLRLIVLFGCGGNRSKLRRFEMGEVASKLADLTIVTSDNPRNENPSSIIDDIVTGIEHFSGSYIRIENRKEAIEYCITHAKKGDIIVLAGKGHEVYQEINNKKYELDERLILLNSAKEKKLENSLLS